MSILNNEQIIAAINNKNVVINPFEHNLIEAASLDLRVGKQAITTSSEGIIDLESKDFFVIKPGDFALFITKEYIELDNQHTARIGLRSKWAMQGISATLGPQIDPGFKGRLKIGLTNISPEEIPVSFNDPFLTLEFHKLSTPSTKPYKGPNQNFDCLTSEDLKFIFNKPSMSFPAIIESLASLSKNVSSLAKSVEQLQRNEQWMRWMIPLGFGFLTIVIALFAVFA